MQTYSTAFERELIKLIQEQIDELLSRLAAGVAVTDYATYQNYVGKIASFQKAIELCDEANEILKKQ